MTDGDLGAGFEEDLDQRPGRHRLHLDRRLVGLDLGDRLAALDTVSDRLEPRLDRALLHVVAEVRHRHLDSHSAPPPRSRVGHRSACAGNAALAPHVAWLGRYRNRFLASAPLLSGPARSSRGRRTRSAGRSPAGCRPARRPGSSSASRSSAAATPTAGMSRRTTAIGGWCTSAITTSSQPTNEMSRPTSILASRSASRAPCMSMFPPAMIAVGRGSLARISVVARRPCSSRELASIDRAVRAVPGRRERLLDGEAALSRRALGPAGDQRDVAVARARAGARLPPACPRRGRTRRSGRSLPAGRRGRRGRPGTVTWRSAATVSGWFSSASERISPSTRRRSSSRMCSTSSSGLPSEFVSSSE